MTARDLPGKFLVAFSFAGEQRELVRAVAEAVEQDLGAGKVFLDEWYEHYLAGHDADLKLQEIYGERSALVVVCVSERYGGKPWTQAEHEAIRARLMKARASEDGRQRDAILPIRVGDGEIKGLPLTAIVPDVRGRSAARTAELILNRLRLVAPEALAPPGTPPEPAAAPRVFLAETTPDLGELRHRLDLFLRALGWTVLPGEPYPRDAYRARLEADLRQCRAFVQLLGPAPWPGENYDRIQSEMAGALPLARFRHRNPDLDLKPLDAPHREFIASTDVIATGFEDFKAHLEQELSRLALQTGVAAGKDLPPRVLVALRCQDPDLFWERAFQWIYEQEQIDHCQLRPGESFEARWQAEPCHGFLVVCDASALNDDDRSPRGCMEQCREIQLKLKDARRRPPVGLVYWPPPSASWARLLRSTPLKLYRVLGDSPTNLGEFFAEVRRVAQ